jgi:hypothetical protein
MSPISGCKGTHKCPIREAVYYRLMIIGCRDTAQREGDGHDAPGYDGNGSKDAARGSAARGGAVAIDASDRTPDGRRVSRATRPGHYAAAGTADHLGSGSAGWEPHEGSEASHGLTGTGSVDARRHDEPPSPLQTQNVTEIALGRVLGFPSPIHMPGGLLIDARNETTTTADASCRLHNQLTGDPAMRGRTSACNTVRWGVQASRRRSRA